MSKKITDLSLNFAVDIVKLSDKLRAQRRYSLGDQLLQSCTSVGANIHEAQVPFGRKDFFRKMQIAASEAEEANYWLMVLQQSEICNEPIDQYQKDLNVIRRMLARILTTTKQRINEN
jgi:four helix bundle protein